MLKNGNENGLSLNSIEGADTLKNVRDSHRQKKNSLAIEDFQESSKTSKLVRSSSKASMKTFPKKVKTSFEQARRRSIEGQGREGSRSIGRYSNHDHRGTSISMLDVYGMNDDRRSMVFSPMTGKERRRRNSEMSSLLSTNTPSRSENADSLSNRVAKGESRWSGNYSPTNMEEGGTSASPTGSGFHYYSHLIDGFEPDCGPDKRILILS